MNREQITLNLESAMSRLRELRQSGPRMRWGSADPNRVDRMNKAKERLLIAEIDMLSAHRRVLDAQDILSALGGAR